jgi:hypothetical protein
MSSPYILHSHVIQTTDNKQETTVGHHSANPALGLQHVAWEELNLGNSVVPSNIHREREQVEFEVLSHNRNS